MVCNSQYCMPESGLCNQWRPRHPLWAGPVALAMDVEGAGIRTELQYFYCYLSLNVTHTQCTWLEWELLKWCCEIDL